MHPKSSLEKVALRIPVFISRYGKWFVATAPQLDLVAKGATFEEAKENMQDLLNEYSKDPDTIKPATEELAVFDITFIPINISQGAAHNKAKVFG